MENIEPNKEAAVEQEAIAPRPSREPLFGTLLFTVIIIAILAIIAAVGYAAYAGWKTNKEQAARPSIADLAVKAGEPVSAEKPAVSEKEQPAAETKPESASAATAKDIAVLNGGAAKGTAGVVADFLKQEGYTKVTAGNSVKDYTGVTVYYAAGLDKEAAALKASLAKKYPAAVTLAAVAGNKETSTASLTVIIGK